jgi:hypothetical protein
VGWRRRAVAVSRLKPPIVVVALALSRVIGRAPSIAFRFAPVFVS